MENYEKVTGGDVTAIPHNGNLSNGMMFALQDDFADGKAHPLLSPEDEFADFETWDFGNLDV
jgi:hypothetical protein